MATQYRVEHLPNGLYRVFDQRTRAVTVLNANGTFRHGFPMAPIHIHDALKQAGFDVVPLSKMQIPTASFVPLREMPEGKKGPLLNARGEILGASEYKLPNEGRLARLSRNAFGAGGDAGGEFHAVWDVVNGELKVPEEEAIARLEEVLEKPPGARELGKTTQRMTPEAMARQGAAKRALAGSRPDQWVARESYDDLLRQIKSSGYISRLGGTQDWNRGGPGARSHWEMLSDGFDNMLREVQEDLKEGRLSLEEAERYVEARKTATERLFIERTDTEFVGDVGRGAPRGEGYMHDPKREAQMMMGNSAKQADRKVSGARHLFRTATGRVPKWRPSDISFDDLLKIGRSAKTAGKAALKGGSKLLGPLGVAATGYEVAKGIQEKDPARALYALAPGAPGGGAYMTGMGTEAEAAPEEPEDPGMTMDVRTPLPVTTTESDLKSQGEKHEQVAKMMEEGVPMHEIRKRVAAGALGTGE